MSGIAAPPHAKRASTNYAWITPRWILERFGPFDLDPCASTTMPWPTAAQMLTVREDGLMSEWSGLVWLNPPYGRALGLWLNRLALHGNGIALVFARTDTRAFHDHVWPFADALLFLRGRVTFCTPKGEPAPLGHNSGGPSVLIAYGSTAVERLERCRDLGALVYNQPNLYRRRN